jgi:hypothetical protein
MAKKKLQEAAPEPEKVEAAVQQEAAPEPATEVSAELPDNAHTYYVWKDGAFVKFFTNEDHKGEAKKFALLFAEEIGGTVEASGLYK